MCGFFFFRFSLFIFSCVWKIAKFLFTLFLSFYLFIIVHSLVSNGLERHESHAHDVRFVSFWTGGIVHGCINRQTAVETRKRKIASAPTHSSPNHRMQHNENSLCIQNAPIEIWPENGFERKIVKSQIVSNRSWLNFWFVRYRRRIHFSGWCYTWKISTNEKEKKAVHIFWPKNGKMHNLYICASYMQVLLILSML